MPMQLGHIVAQADIQRLSLVGLAKNVGKTTATNHIMHTLLTEGLYQREELGLTSLGIDGEAIDALTSLPKPRYLPESGLLIATAKTCLVQSESEGALFQYCRQLPGRTALGPVFLARVKRSGPVVIAGPTLLEHLRSTLGLFYAYGARLAIIDGAINRLSIASPCLSDACILCTGTSVAASVELTAKYTASMLARLSIPTTMWQASYRKHYTYLSMTIPGVETILLAYDGVVEPVPMAEWMMKLLEARDSCVYLLRGALTEEFASILLRQKRAYATRHSAELVFGDATKVFCSPLTLERLAAEGLQIRVALPIRILAISLNPFTPAYSCTSQNLLETLQKVLPERRPPLLDVCSGEGA